MLKLAVLVCLVALCAAQTPTRPKIPETFVSQGEVEFHREDRTLMGKARIERDQEAMKGLERSEYAEDHLVFEHLERYDMGEEYTLRENGTDHHCEPEKVSGGLPLFWDWVEQAKYAGTRKYHERTLDIWQFEAGGTRLELGVAQDAPNQPVVFNRRESHGDVGFAFMAFNATKPPTDDFNVPSDCEARIHPISHPKKMQPL